MSIRGLYQNTATVSYSGIYLENSEVLSDVITRNVNFWSDVAKVQASLEQVSAIYKNQAIRLPPQSAEVFHARI